MYTIAHAVTIFTITALFMLCAILFLSWCIRPLRERKRAQETYECGFPAHGNARAIGFTYLHYAALFLVFDLAALFLFLYAAVPQPVEVTIAFFLGVGILGLMILYGTRPRRYHAA